MRPDYLLSIHLTMWKGSARRRLLGLLTGDPQAPTCTRAADVWLGVAARQPIPPSSSRLFSNRPNDSSFASISKLLVANRGEIACRVLSTAKRLGIPTVAIYSEADRLSKHVRLADEAFYIGKSPARESYLQAEAVLDLCSKAGGRSVHPGYGFLSENASFADACQQRGIAFVGPPGAAIRAMGDKSEAKRIMSAAGVPVVPGYHGSDQSDQLLLAEASRIGFPLLVKAVSGGGGKGMKLATSLAEVGDAIASAKREAASSFGDDRVLLERYIQRPRHVEVQVVCDSLGNAVYLFDRDCSMQRRHQKVIEEAPAPGLSDEFHRHIGEAAVRAALAVGYVNAGTVEFIVDTDHPDRSFYFMEMNTRLQVEHPVTEEVSGVDLVEWQLRVAAGLPLPCTQASLGPPRGHAFEARLYAESPRRNFLPGAGTVRRWRLPAGAGSFCPPTGPGAAPSGAVKVRVDSGVEEGDAVGDFYDPMIAKIVTWGPDRASALAALSGALAQTQVAGLPVNLPFLQRLAAHPGFRSAQDLTTAFIKDEHALLLAPAALPPRAAAVAAVARYLTEVWAASAPGTGGAWAVRDGKRLWSQMTREFAGMVYPEGEGGVDASVSCSVKVLSQDSFDVTRLSGSGGAGSPAGDGGHKQVRVRGAKLDVGGGRVEAEVDGQRVQADVLVHSQGGSEVLSLWMDGQAFELRWQLPSWSKDAGAAQHSPGGKVLAPMPGRVIQVLAKEGQAVAAGAQLLILEAMKMEHPVLAPKAGVVRDVAVSVGGQVADGQLLLWVDDAKEEVP